MLRSLPLPTRSLAYSSLLFALACAEGGTTPTSGPEGGSGQGGATVNGTVTEGGSDSINVNAGGGGTTSTLTAIIAYCGDGLVDPAKEVCDDGNQVSGDGCTAGCDQIEVGYACPTPGQACVNTAVCGDGRIGGFETCDFGALGANAACDANCQLQPGWVCPVAGLACIAAECGDGIIAGTEECEFTTGTAPEGCTGSCHIESGYDCKPSTDDATTYTCWVTVCGNGTPERGEQCDDGNALPFDGCYKCRTEPVCSNGTCVASCGDGQRFDTEECDDGNTRSGDGCSSTCTTETGFICVDETLDPATSMAAPVLLRDFVGRNNALNGMAVHNDFNIGYACAVLNAVETQLNANDGRPVFNCPSGVCTNNPADWGCYLSRQTSNDTTAFDQWYRNVDGINLPIAKEISLTRQTDGTYKYDSLNTTNKIFDLISTEGWVAALREQQVCNPLRNVSFTSETHFWFQYQGGEHFVFSGDDDTWVFVNNTLVIDLGGTHERQEAYFTLDADTDGTGTDTADGTAVWTLPTTNTIQNYASAYGTYGTEKTVNTNLTLGGIYEVVVFQAERNQCDSNFGITMSNFSKPRSVCSSYCGDGIVASTELCDDGTNTSVYNGCGPGCILTPYCGDGTVQGNDGEECDDGLNISLYGGCAPGCKKGPYCGDGLVQSAYEHCDDGVNDGGYGECASNCAYAEFCGDGILQPSNEECDNGPNNGQNGCEKDCTSSLIQ